MIYTAIAKCPNCQKVHYQNLGGFGFVSNITVTCNCCNYRYKIFSNCLDVVSNRDELPMREIKKSLSSKK